MTALMLVAVWAEVVVYVVLFVWVLRLVRGGRGRG
jgi:hypothetical protein